MGSSPTAPMTRLASFDIIKVTEAKWHELEPYDRHDIAVQLAKVASAEGAVLPESIERYASETLNPRFEQVMEHRASCMTNEELVHDYQRLGKVAEAMTTDEAVEALYMLDEQAGLLGKYGSYLSDPLLAVYGHEKKASYSWIEGGLYVNERQIALFSENPMLRKRMKALFTDDLFEKFRAAPLKTFKELPQEQKRLVARMATQSDITNDGGMIS